MREVVMNEQAAEFDAEVFLRERLIRQVGNHIVAVSDAVGAGAGGQG